MSIENILTSSRLRKLQLFIPPPNNLLLTTYLKSLNQKIIPLKQKFNVFSKISISSKEKSVNIYLNKNQISQVKRSYKALKNIQKKSVLEQEEEYMNDPTYKSLIKLRQKMSIKASINLKNSEISKFKFLDNSFTNNQRMFLTQTVSPRSKQKMNTKNSQLFQDQQIRLRQRNSNYHRKMDIKQRRLRQQHNNINIQNQNQIISIRKTTQKQKLDIKFKKFDFRSRAQSSGSLSKIS